MEQCPRFVVLYDKLLQVIENKTDILFRERVNFRKRTFVFKSKSKIVFGVCLYAS